jgi:hypothetical protein
VSLSFKREETSFVAIVGMTPVEIDLQALKEGSLSDEDLCPSLSSYFVRLF